MKCASFQTTAKDTAGMSRRRIQCSVGLCTEYLCCEMIKIVIIMSDMSRSIKGRTLPKCEEMV